MPDAVVIGAGPNGLVAANGLAGDPLARARALGAPLPPRAARAGASVQRRHLRRPLARPRRDGGVARLVRAGRWGCLAAPDGPLAPDRRPAPARHGDADAAGSDGGGAHGAARAARSRSAG